MPKRKIGFEVPGSPALECPACGVTVQEKGTCDRCVVEIEAKLRAEFNLPKDK